MGSHNFDVMGYGKAISLSTGPLREGPSRQQFADDAATL